LLHYAGPVIGALEEYESMENPVKKRVEYLLELCRKLLGTETNTQFESNVVDDQLYNRYRAASLSFLHQYYGEEHPYYISFYTLHRNYAPTVKQTLGILQAVLDEIENGWFLTVRRIVSAEIFSDFVEMASHLLENNYKDAAAVMLGSTLEEHLRQLARDNGIDVEFEKSDKIVPKKADVLNADLAKADVYSKLDQKNVTAWLDLRNKAAHGQYSEYSKEQVDLFCLSLTDFMARVR